jgi:hypothetical protein
MVAFKCAADGNDTRTRGTTLGKELFCELSSYEFVNS